MHCVYEPVQANEQRPFRQDTMALGSVGHTLPHLPLREPGSASVLVMDARSPGDTAIAAHQQRFATSAQGGVAPPRLATGKRTLWCPGLSVPWHVSHAGRVMHLCN